MLDAEDYRRIAARYAALATAYGGPAVGFRIVAVVVPGDALPVVAAALARAQRAGASADPGVALERICADYLAGPDVDGSPPEED